MEHTERISNSFFAAAPDCNEFERRVLSELLIADTEVGPKVGTTDKQKEAVSKCELQENSPRQKLDKVVRIQFLMDLHDFFVGLFFR